MRLDCTRDGLGDVESRTSSENGSAAIPIAWIGFPHPASTTGIAVTLSDAVSSTVAHEGAKGGIAKEQAFQPPCTGTLNCRHCPPRRPSVA